MDKENKRNAAVSEAGGASRVTRARARALTGGILQPMKPYFKPDPKRTLLANSKRAASDENAAGRKRRAVLGDISNVYCTGSNAVCFPKAGQVQSKGSGKCPSRKPMELADGSSSNQIMADADDAKTKLAEELSKIRVEEAQDAVKETRETANPSACLGGTDDPMLLTMTSAEQDQGRIHPTRALNIHLEQLDASPRKDVIDIDSDVKDPELGSIYVSDIQKNIRVQELDQRPSTTYMEELQQDINPSMRAILIDWLVEVSEEYKLVRDTLYLTVNIIDRFLSGNYIEKQRLQLLGVSSMLIASKYEEICAPRVEEFCFITDNTYTRDEVVKFESQVVNFLYFQLAVPTTKTFLRRFIYAAQASNKAPSRELEFLANYLAELTLLDYDFLKFLPSLIAASAVFLARWTLSQTANPWNPTLEHYTRYKASDLKTAVLALEGLQLNTNNCPLNAVRDKYKQQKYESVATLTSSQRVSSIFQGHTIPGSI